MQKYDCESQIIFLDIDGVLNSRRTEFGIQKTISNPNGWDPVAIRMLNYIAKSFQVLFVISSTWRTLIPEGLCVEYLTQMGFNGEFHDRWKTPNFNCPFSRGMEINRWFEDCPNEYYTGYVIIDDSSAILEKQKDYHVHVDQHEGFLYGDMVQAIRILERNSRISRR